MDTRRDPGQYYPGGKVISTLPVATDGDVKHSDFEDLNVKTNTLPDLRAAVKGMAARLGATVVTALAVCAAIGATVEKAKLNELDFDADPSVVINVTFEGLATTNDLAAAANELRGAVDTKADTAKDVVTTRWRFDATGLILEPDADDSWAADDANYMQYVADRGVYRWTLAGYGAGLCYGGADAAALTNATGTAYTFTRLSATNQYDVAYMDDVAAAVAPLCTIEAAEAMRAAESNRVDAAISSLSSALTAEISTATNALGQAITTVEAKTPNNITRTGTDATLVHADGGNTTNLIYIRQASSSLAGLMTAADKSAFDTMKQTVGDHGAAIAANAETNTQTRAIVTTWENFLDGSNVVFSITNYLSGTYNLDTAKLKILELRDGAYQEVYNSRDEILLHIDAFRTNDFRVATNQVIGAVNEAIDGKADRDWGKYTSAGGDAPANTVYMTAPNTVFAGGLEYERVAVGEGSICVLTTRGAPVWTQGDEGTFKFQDDGGTNYFGFAKTDSYTIGANTDGITVQGGMVTMQYNITMSGRPCVWYKSSLSPAVEWEQLNLPDGSPVAGASHAVTWETNPDPGTQVCYINVGNQPQGFFRATVEVAGEAKFMTNMPADLSGGWICPNTATGVNGVIKPSFNGSSVIWTWSAN